MPSDDDFLRAFEATTLPKSDWTHSAHIRLAWLYLERFPFNAALGKVKEGIQRYNAAVGVLPGAYHDTVTEAYVRIIAHKRSSKGTTDFESFAARHPELFSRSDSPLLKHYSQATILSEEARRGFVPPDLLPLPILAVVRDALPSDAEAIARIYAPYVSKTAISFELVPPDASEMKRRLLEYQETHPWLVATVESDVIAYAYASPYRTRPAYRWSAEVSVYTDAGVHRRGAGRMLYEALLAELARLGYRQAIAGIALPNEASVRFHEALGFETSGVMRRIGFKLGAWHDVGFWQLALGGVGPPKEPPFARASQPAKSAQ